MNTVGVGLNSAVGVAEFVRVDAWVGDGSRVGVTGAGVDPTGGTKIGGVLWYKLHPVRESMSVKRTIRFTGFYR
jgi:tetrahydrodipicolinate N-succinyltransferase